MAAFRAMGFDLVDAMRKQVADADMVGKACQPVNALQMPWTFLKNHASMTVSVPIAEHVRISRVLHRPVVHSALVQDLVATGFEDPVTET